MKICIVSSSIYPHAGLGRAVLSIADGLAERGHTIGIISSGGETKHALCTVSLRVNLFRPLRLFSELFKMRSFMRSYDLIVAFDPRPAGILTHLACFGLRKDIIIHTLGTYALFERNNLIKNLLIQWVYAKSKRIFVINSFVQHRIEESKKKFMFGQNLSIVPIGVDTTLFYPHPYPSYPYGRRYIISVGALKTRKGQHTSVCAFINIAHAFPDVHYVLVGDAEEGNVYAEQIRKTIKKANLENRIHLIQNISDDELIDLYSGAQFFVLTPVTTKDFIEGFGMVYLEAALCGIPSIGTWNTGAEAAIEHQKSGLLVAGTVASIAEGMRMLLTDDIERTKYALYARQRALSFDWLNVVNAYEKEITDMKK